jgi:hypothetical protein
MEKDILWIRIILVGMGNAMFEREQLDYDKKYILYLLYIFYYRFGLESCKYYIT